MSKRSSSTNTGQFVVVAFGVLALLLGGATSALEMAGVVDFSQTRDRLMAPWRSWRQRQQTKELQVEPESASQVKSLGLAAPAERAEPLASLATQSNQDGARARFLLASDLIQQGQAGTALPLLENLEQDYDVLAPYVALRRAQALTATGDTQAATAAWQALLTDYGSHPVAAEALYVLGQAEPSHWERAIAEFPTHPRTVDIAQARLAAGQGDELANLLITARSGLHLPGITGTLDRLVSTYADDLTPDDWQTIAFGYWENLSYRKAGEAYARADVTPRHLYRAARGLQLGEERAAAIATYEQLAAEFPDAPETADGLLKLSQMVAGDRALEILDQVVATFPDRAAAALLERALVLDELDQAEAATQTRELILSQHSETDAAATVRWQRAQAAAASSDSTQAGEWARQLLVFNPNSDVAPEAGFWAGKWALKTNQPDQAQRIFELVISLYPESYYAWRSAVQLGWPVGDFQTVRTQTPAIALPRQRSTLPAGSETLIELYQLGQNRDAWTLWQTEFTNPQEPTVAEQFTDGLIRLAVGDNLDGIFMLSNLSWREDPADQQAYQELAKQDAYWEAMYPFPYFDLIETWSRDRQLNPLLVTALMRQESRFEAQIESVVGAKGLMQVMPSTAEWIDLQANIGDYQLSNPQDNIELGTWYLRYTHQEYGDNSLYAVASYNAGPGNVADWISRFQVSDNDDFARQIPFPETHNYIRAVFGGYWNYLRLYNPDVHDRVEQYTSRQSTAATVLGQPTETP